MGPLSILPHSSYYIERDDEIKIIKYFIENNDEAVIGLTGVRGVGKSSVMEKIISDYEEKYFTLKIPAPVSYEQKEFFITVFKRVCEDVINKIERILRIDKSLENIAQMLNKKRNNVIILSLVMVIAIFLIFQFYIISLAYSQNGLEILAELLKYDILIYLIIFSFLIGLFTYFHAIIRKKYSIFYGDYRLFGALYIKTSDILETLEYEKSLSYESGGSVSILKQIKKFFSLKKELKTRNLTLPGLNVEYMKYLENVKKVFGEKVIICIDELDKIVNQEDVEKILRSIKGALFQKNCYYLISISEDSVKYFRRRFYFERDIFESTFDEIIDLNRVNLVTSIKILRERIKESISQQYYGSLCIIATLSGGIPRELIRNLRIILYKNRGKTPPINTTFRLLFINKIIDSIGKIKTSDIEDSLKDVILNKIIEIHDALNQGSKNLSSFVSTRIRDSYDLLSKKEDLTSRKSNGISMLMKAFIELTIYSTLLSKLDKLNSPLIESDETFLKCLLNSYMILPYSRNRAIAYLNEAKKYKA